ncbi:MAG: dihydrofolate reductase [Oceanospirillaceae bacterium]|nr:dihydrofolate reductase [Oceanospirillaceae bacterium]
MKLAIIVAQSTNRVIGKNNDLPWKLPKDLQYFKKVTLGKPIIMGRNTFESIGRPLPGRVNIVVTSNTEYKREGIEVFHSLTAAIEYAQTICQRDGVDEAMIIGGAQIYSQTLPLVDALYITQVDAQIEGDAFFPEIDYRLFEREYREDHVSDEHNPYSYSFIRYVKKSTTDHNVTSL